MLHFLLGRPGSGKTYTVIERIKQAVADRKRVLLVVPEQQVYSTERDILSSLPPDAGRALTIVSFTRLCDLVETCYGGRAAMTLNRATRALLMWQNLRELSGLLEAYGQSGGTARADTSLCRLMLETVDELTASGISPERLEAVTAHISPESPLYPKIRDISLITASYGRLVAEVCGENPADRLLRAAARMSEHTFFEGTIVFIDSFTSFTAQEYAVIRAMLCDADDLTITLCTERRATHEPQFESVCDTLGRLTRLCEDANRAWEDTVLTRPETDNASELAFLERALWNFTIPPRKEEDKPPSSTIRVHAAVNLYDEAEAVALHILEQYRAGIPYSRMAVVVRDVADWRGVLDAALEQYHIPFFLSERTDLETKPAARLLLCALRAVGRRWQTGDIISLLKTGLCGISAREADLFCEYVETWKLSGTRMEHGPWSMNPDGYKTDISSRGKQILSAANRVREVIMTPLTALSARLATSGTVTDQCRALYTYLCDLDIKAQLARTAEQQLSLDQVREAGETVRLWSFLCEALATLAATLPEDCRPLSPDELIAVLSLLFSETDIGSIPARHDCVTVGSAQLLRVDNMRASFLLGLSEGEFPRTVGDMGLFSEQEKQTLADLGVSLDSRESRRSSEELMYVWRAMTKPTEMLTLSYSTSTPDGRKKSPSAALMRVLYLFPYIKPLPFSSAMLPHKRGESVLSDKYTPPGRDTVPRATIHRLLGNRIWLSQSRLQAYSRCPYSYYGSHILHLREPADAKLDNVSSGVFLHHVLEHFLRATLDGHHRIDLPSTERAREIADQIITDYMGKLCGDTTDRGSLLHVFARLRSVTLTLIETICAESVQSSFATVALEWDTHGRQEGEPSPMEISLQDGGDENNIRLMMGGVIDRVDTYRSEDGSRVYIRVIDYKSSKHVFHEKSITEDMNVQLLLYLFTLCAPENRYLFADETGRIPDAVLPAEALYLSPDTSGWDGTIKPVRSGVILHDEEILRAASADLDPTYLPGVTRDKSGCLSGKGLCSPEKMANLEETLRAAIRDTAARMYDGCAHRTPSTDACKFCAMRSGCPVAAKVKQY